MPTGLSLKLSPTDLSERCGVISDKGEIIETENLSLNPTQSFEIPPADMIRPGIVATWHTHPNASANLSHLDYAGFLQWPDLKHYIVGIDGVRGFEVQSGLVVGLE